MTDQEVLVFAEKHFPMLEWSIKKDWDNEPAIFSEHRKWKIKIRWWKADKYRPQGGLEIQTSNSVSGSGGIFEVEKAFSFLMKKLKDIDPKLTEEIQMVLL